MKKTKGKANKKRIKQEVINRVDEINRGDVKEKPKRISKYRVISEYIRQHNGEFSRQELIAALEKDHQYLKSQQRNKFLMIRNREL